MVYGKRGMADAGAPADATRARTPQGFQSGARASALQALAEGTSGITSSGRMVTARAIIFLFEVIAPGGGHARRIFFVPWQL